MSSLSVLEVVGGVESGRADPRAATRGRIVHIDDVKTVISTEC